MTLLAEILDERNEESTTCFLAKVTLESYIDSLPSAYQSYDVQREVVANVYLDHLVNTVLEKRHIPPIVLVVDSKDFKRRGNHLDIRTFKILDGLQRTFRLKTIRDTIHYAVSTDLDQVGEYLAWNRFKFSRYFSAELREIDSNTEVLRAVFQKLHADGEKCLLETLSANGQWFEIWTGLTPEDEVRKMLTLNAGHKPVKTRHQLELLFLNLLPLLREGEGERFHIVREKEVGSTQFSKGREVGNFHFAHIITSLLSLYNGKPVAPSTDLIQGIQSNENSIEEYGELMTPEFLKRFVSFLVQLDQAISKKYGELGIRWLGREVSLAGLFGAIGAVADKDESGRETVMSRMLVLIKKDAGILRLDEFETVRNSVELSKVNIGNINRAAVYAAVELVLENSGKAKIDWRKLFAKGSQ
ncbi:UNVERIFIED_ORG: hypothetical protein DFO49_1969 [Herbaspirillum seropedicae]|jgi:hypothetical protein